LARPARGVLPSVTAAAFASFADIHETRRRIDRTDILAGAIVLGALTCAAPVMTLDGETCARPPAMLERIAAFNHHLLMTATPLPELDGTCDEAVQENACTERIE
jgi:hypothetical protein